MILQSSRKSTSMGKVRSNRMNPKVKERKKSATQRKSREVDETNG